MRNSANLEAGRKYLVEIQAEYRDEPERIEAFNQLMRDFADNRFDTQTVMDRIAELFHDSPTLIKGFNAFLPPGAEVYMDGGETRTRLDIAPEYYDMGKPPRTGPPSENHRKTPKKPNTEFVRYKQEVEAAFQNEPDRYHMFRGLMRDFGDNRIDGPTLVKKIAALFQGYPHLIEGFNVFVPPGYEQPTGLPARGARREEEHRDSE